ncbi:MAG: hypothetical protein ACYC6F_08020 [Longimicrobiales bacterium]
MTTSAARRPPFEAAGNPGRWISTSGEGVGRWILSDGGTASRTSSRGTLRLVLSAVRVGGRTYEVGLPTPDGRAALGGRST